MATTFAGFPACSDPAGAAIAVLGVPNATPYTLGQASHCAGAPAALRADLTGYATMTEPHDFDIGDLACGGVGVGRKGVDAVSHAAGGNGKHAAELAATEHADYRAGEDHGRVSFMTWSVWAAR